MEAGKRSLDWIQALRGFAALAVVFCHSRSFYREPAASALAEDWMLPGAAGVDLFFMLSGFIMVYSTVHSGSTIASSVNFLIKRFARIWPVYAVFTISWALLEGVVKSFSVTTFKTVVLSLLFLPADPSKMLYYGTTLPVGWSLNFEIYFYLLFGACLLFGRFRWTAFTLWMIGTLVLLPWSHGRLSADIWQSHEFPILYLDLITNPIIAEFVIGVAIGIAYLNDRLRFSNQVIAYLACTCSTVFALGYTLQYRGPIHGLGSWGWAIALCFFCLAIASKTVTLSTPRFFVAIGEISFSLYLVHPFVHRVTRFLLDQLRLASSIDTSALILVMTAVSIILAQLSYRFLEKGLAETVRNRLLRREAKIQAPTEKEEVFDKAAQAAAQ
ncbi:MAG: acyltransferase family protein [Methylomonas sp.]